VLLPLLLILGVVSPAAAQPAEPNDTLRRFVAELRQASAREDREALARLMRYPLQVTAGAVQIPVRNAASFVELFQTIMTPEMKAVIARARVPAAGQSVAGVRMGPGAVSFEDALVIERGDSGFRVTRLSVPLTSRNASPGRAAAARTLTFRVGRPTQVSGSLDPGGRDRYQFHAIRGTFIEARLSGVPGRTVLLRLVDAGTGRAVDRRADAGTRVWIGRVSATAGYRIEVVRQPDSGQETLIYTLSVELK